MASEGSGALPEIVGIIACGRLIPTDTNIGLFLRKKINDKLVVEGLGIQSTISFKGKLD